jgi:hypothetical protein
VKDPLAVACIVSAIVIVLFLAMLVVSGINACA